MIPRFANPLLVLTLLAACNGKIYLRDGVTDGDTFYLSQRAVVDDDPVLQSWVTYSLSLSTCQLQIGGDNPARNSSFDCELKARRQLVERWADKQRQDRDLTDDYLDLLALTDRAGYLAEYTVTHHRRSGWRMDRDLDLAAYRRWSRRETPGLDAETRLIGSWNYAGNVAAY